MLALDLGAGGAWDGTSIGVPFVWCEAGQARPWRMIYRGAIAANPTSFSLGLATSLDGVAWERKDTAGNVLSTFVLTKTLAAWDASAIDFGGIINVGSTYYLYYNTIATATRKIGLATSTDLVTWTKDADNPLYIGTVGEDIVGATPDDNQGRFCGDIVRWDTPGGTLRYAMFIPHYVATHTTPEIEVYTCSSPKFARASRLFAGTMFRTAITPVHQQLGLNIIASGTDTPRIVTDDITRNVTAGILTGHEVRATLAVYPGAWDQSLLLWDKTLAGKLEPDGTLSGCKFVNVNQDLPVAAPVIKLATRGIDANVCALWLPGQTGTMLDISGNSIHLGKSPPILIDGSGMKLISTNPDYAKRSPSAGNSSDALNLLEAIRNNWSIEWLCTFATNYNSGSRGIWTHKTSTTVKHLQIYITGGATNYTIVVELRSGAASKTTSITFPVASVIQDARYRFAVCEDEDNGKLYAFKDGVLLNAGGNNFNWVIDDYSATDPPVPLYIGIFQDLSSPWSGYIDELRVSNICRHSTDYTPANFVINYQASGQIFTGVYDAGAAKKGVLNLLGKTLPTGTSITVTARNAANITDQSVTAGDFTLDNPTGQYHQYLITLATTDAMVSPSITGAVPMV